MDKDRLGLKKTNPETRRPLPSILPKRPLYLPPLHSQILSQGIQVITNTRLLFHKSKLAAATIILYMVLDLSNTANERGKETDKKGQER